MTDRDELVRTVPRRALVLVDVQNEYARLPLRIRYPRLRDCMERIERVLDAAESAGLPVVCVQHAGPPGGAIFAPEGRASSSARVSSADGPRSGNASSSTTGRSTREPTSPHGCTSRASTP